ncbi:hypothetical protein C8F04DRAFT_1147973 [Mycena alexandri]|uniref:Uncharacterized protein n=1 Tax=Mycena alexandri TaxID=1745969 RepID=A0AAD6S149_9AGAR|nr:hypothetical protein C8F04DRAFT_1147973 [Mycena alexandri]
MPMMQPPNAFAHTGPGHGQHPFYPPPPSQLPTPTDSRPPHPHPPHASAPQQQYAYSVPFPYPPPAQLPMSSGGPPLQTMPSQQHTSIPGNAQHITGVRRAVSASQQRPIPSAHASTSRQGPPPPVPYPQEPQLVPSNYSTSPQVRISTSILPPLPPPPPARGPGHGGELPVLDSPEYIEELKRRVKFHEEERTRLAEAVRTLEGLLARAHQQYVANGREHTEFVKQATEKNHGLRAERDTARGERDAALAECQRLRSQRDEAVHNGLGLRREQVQFQERMRELEETVQRWQQTGTASLTHIQRLRGERDELKARVKHWEAAAREAAATTAVVVPKVEGVVDEKAPDALITPKPEPLDDLELQYPPDEPEPEPMAGPSTSLPDDAATLYSAGPSTSPSTFIAWEPPPPPFEAPEDRKRTREEYEAGADADGEARPSVRPRLDADADADADGGFSMGPAFPLPRDVSLAVGALNSPVRYFMEVRRKAHG